MNTTAFQKFLATGDFTVTEDAAANRGGESPRSPTSLAAHDRRFHKGGFDPNKGRCQFREALAKGDNSDASLAAAEKKEAKQKSNIDKYLSMPDDGFAKDVMSLDEKGIKRLESEIKGFLANSIPNADVKVVKDQPEKGQFAIAVAGTSDDKLLTALSSYPRTGYWSFTDRYEGNNVKLDGDDKPRKYAFLSFKTKDDVKTELKGADKLKGSSEEVLRRFGVKEEDIPVDARERVKMLDKFTKRDEYLKGAEERDKKRIATAQKQFDSPKLVTKSASGFNDDGTYNHKKDIYGFGEGKDYVEFTGEELDKLDEKTTGTSTSKQEKIAKLQKLHEDYNKWFETADRSDIHAWLDEEEKWVKDLKDALEGLEIGKDIQWDSDKRNFYALSDKKDKPTFNPDNRFHMAEDDDLWRRRNEGDADAKVLADLVMDYNRENKWGFSGEDIDAYVKAFEDMDHDRFPKGLPEQSDRNEARKEKFASVISSRPELIRLYIIERLTDANYHREVKALSEGRYDDVMED